MMAETSEPLFRIERLAHVKDQIRALAQKATPLNMTAPLVSALKEIVGRLQTDPLGWGEPEYHTHHPGGVVCHGIRGHLLVRFVLFEPERIVLLLGIWAVPGSPLA